MGGGHYGGDGTYPSDPFRSSGRYVWLFANAFGMAFCIALYLDGDCTGVDHVSCRISIQMEEACFPFESCRAVHCLDYGNLGKCRYAAAENDYPDR